MTSRILLAAVAVLATGCSNIPTKPMNQSGSALRDQSVAVTVREKPTFRTITAANRAASIVPAVGLGLGVVGTVAATMVVEGVQDLAQRNERNSFTARLPDPSHAIAQQLTAALEKRHNMKVANGTVQAPKDAKAVDIALAARGKADYVLDIDVVSWSMAHQVPAWSSYDLKFKAIGSLINVQSGAVVASATCDDANDLNAVNPKGPSYDQMMANDSALLKQMVAYKVTACATTLKRDMELL